MSQTIKAAIVGTGFIGPAHLEALRRIPNVMVTGLVEVNQELAEEKARLLGIPNAYTFEDMLKVSEIDVVHICTPNFLHYAQAKAVLEAGKHVICEKPLAVKIDEAEELVSLAKSKGLVNAVHFNLRYYPVVRQMKTMRESGDLGEVYAVMGSYLQDWLFLQTDYNWRLEPDKSGDSRAIADIGSHLLDITEYVTGLKITEVMADFSTVHKTRLKPLKAIETYSGKMLSMDDYEEVPINTEDHATVMLRFDNGSKGSITVSQVNAGRKNRLNIEIAGSKSNFEFNSERPNELWIGKRESANQHLMKDPALFTPEAAGLISFPGGHNEGFPDTSKQMFKEVYAAVRTGKQPDSPSFPTFSDGLRELIIGERIIESNKKQAWVKI
ncbi:MAG TPA: dehydrogenase [Algoriphagus sp.]|jgi:predicted dehydrogenase|uniref:Gfo/Idh/MocA family protein n=2 Tax=Algoriphagus TaxID=246875 RepID=UPI000C61044D|nr:MULTISPECIES: Gfo/Idh/MocA family oxidoreductase [unclassified Algoriphagus]MAL12020.1 dehydrogenase [Algoriphagus sp.]QYH38561.1 Gfo/Idh/MocA family oxidoreductase [Algoriphagus sp. NBT04N3]HCD87636.1 dehydrogenase [Algoriphagus sp.]HCH43112.1 dehydrogenase [Algoriphagus sp.]|tara:strand:+ start:4189 stop:5337 length:1149 start_codon:yes stop_codon:yes gene_type:complete